MTKWNYKQSSSFQTTVEANLYVTVSMPPTTYIDLWFQYNQILKYSKMV